MKRFYTLLLLLTLSIPVLSQELNFNDLIYLYSNRLDLDKCDSYLTKKNFTYLEYGQDSYVYTQNRKQNKNAEAFAYIGSTSIALQSVKRKTFDYYKQIASTYKLKLIDTGTNPLGNMFFTYENDKYYLSISQGLDEGGSSNTFYLIFFSMN